MRRGRFINRDHLQILRAANSRLIPCRVWHTVGVNGLPAYPGSNWPRWVDEPTQDGAGPVWVAADESGSTGENLIDPQGVIAHATVCIDDESAAPLLEELRSRAGSLQAPEVKFAQFARERGLIALSNFLAPDGYMDDRVNISVGDKRFIIVSKMIDLLVEEEARERGVDMYSDLSAREMARTFFTEGKRGLGEFWEPLLAAFVSLARATQRKGVKEDVESFFARLEHARLRCQRNSVEEVLAALLRARKHAEDLVLSTSIGEWPVLDPMVAMLPLSIAHWYSKFGMVRMLHDEHKLFTPEFTQDFLMMLWHAHTVIPQVPQLGVAEFCVGSSRKHPSVQLADLAASAGRVVIEAYLGRPSRAADVLRDSVMCHIRSPWLLADDDIGHNA